MRPPSPPSFRPGLLDRAGLPLKVPLVARSIVRGIQRRPGRAFLAVIGLALAVALTLSGRFMFDAVDFMKRLEFEEVWRQDLAVGFVQPLSPAVRWELGRLPGVSRVELMRDVPVRLGHGAASARTAIQAFEEGSVLHRLMAADRAAMPPPAAGVLLSTVLARRLGVAPGDPITVEVLQGRRQVLSLRVAGLIEDLLGISAYMRFDALHRALQEAPVATGALLAADPGEREALNRRLKRLPGVSGATWLDVMRAGFEQTIAESFRISIVSLVAFAVIIAGGVVYNAARVSLAERGRELASLRVLGFSRGEVAGMLLGEQAVLTLLAIPVGLLLGRALCWLVVTRFTSDIFRIPLVISDVSQLLAVAVVLLASAGSAAVIWRRIRRLDLVTVLKTRE